MYLLDSSGQLVDAECSLDVFDGEPCITLESSGGSNPARGIARRNPAYNQLLALVLERLHIGSVEITRIVLDSRKVASIPAADRLVMLDKAYPISLVGIDLNSFRKQVQRKVSFMHRDPDAKKSGNAQKRIRICLSRPIAADELVVHAGDRSSLTPQPPHAPSLTETERNYLATARVGQGQFRERLIQAFNGTCPITGITNPALLLASHIKPWTVCTNEERLDSQNGILLSALLDRLFDRGLISFSTNGKLLVSPKLSASDQVRCGLLSDVELTLNPSQRHYMEYHRALQFRGKI